MSVESDWIEALSWYGPRVAPRRIRAARKASSRGQGKVWGWHDMLGPQRAGMDDIGILIDRLRWQGVFY